MSSANPFLGKYWILPSPDDGQQEEVAIGWHGRDFPVVIASHDWITFAVSTDEWRRFPTLERYLLDNQIDPATIDTVASKGMVISLTEDSPYWPAVDLFLAFGDDQHKVGAREVQALPDEQWVRDLLQATFGRVASDPFERQMHRAAMREKYAAVAGVGPMPVGDTIDRSERVEGWLRFVASMEQIEHPEKPDTKADSLKENQKISRPSALVAGEMLEYAKALRKGLRAGQKQSDITDDFCKSDKKRINRLTRYRRRYREWFAAQLNADK